MKDVQSVAIVIALFVLPSFSILVSLGILRKSLARDSAKIQALLGEIRDKLGK